MARRRKRRASSWTAFPRKIAKVAVNLVFKIAGIAVATKPLHRGFADAASGNFQQATLSWTQDLIGDPAKPDIGKIIGNAITVGVGLGIAWAGGQISRRI